MNPAIREIECPPIEQAFMALASDEHPFWLDSGLAMPGLGRYSILGSRPAAVLRSQDGITEVNQGGRVSSTAENPFSALRKFLPSMEAVRNPEIPFAGGAVGYLGYEMGRFAERVPVAAVNDIGLPDMYMALHDTALVIDNASNRAWIVAADMEAAGRRPAQYRADEMAERMSALKATSARNYDSASGPIECNFTKAEYIRAVQRCKDYISAGDIFQVNLSRRFSAHLPMPAPQLFLKLRSINPAPMSAYLAFDDKALISASPERFLLLREGVVETRPIKGTRPRGADATSDRALAEELLRSEKDNAELAMIVDLERNDLGRVCSYGSVRVTEPRRLESFPTVHHMVATVTGQLHKGRDIVGLLRATFPGGSITGAPKVRAMEIIAELEPTWRSVYTGAIGYIGLDGSADFNIAIRTMITRGDRVWFQAGGGIVADSDPAAEYDETWHKARALADALGGRLADDRRFI